MYLLYLDDAGSTTNAKEDYLVLGGIAVFESEVHWLTEGLHKFAADISKTPNEVEFHASEIFSRRSHPWKGMTSDEAKGVIKAVLRFAAKDNFNIRTFACAVDKKASFGRDPMELAFEDLCSRFDRFLSRIKNEGDRQRGMIVLDESAHETTLRKMATDFRNLGTRWGNIHNLVETPFFVDSKSSRLVQLADHVAYATFRKYNAGDTNYFDIIAHKFDSVDNVVHGLSHKTRDKSCMCIACLTRRIDLDKTSNFNADS